MSPVSDLCSSDLDLAETTFTMTVRTANLSTWNDYLDLHNARHVDNI